MSLFVKILGKKLLVVGRDSAGFEFKDTKELADKVLLSLGFPDEHGPNAAICADPADVNHLQVGENYELSIGQAARLNLTIGPVTQINP
jgi:hypothetical protein